MALAYRGTPTTATVHSGTSIVLTKPAGVVSGDALIIFTMVGTTPSSGPSGFTLQQSSFAAGGELYTKTASGSEPSTYTISFTSSAIGVAVCIAVSGQAATWQDPSSFPAIYDPGTTGSCVVPSITLAGSSDWLLGFFAFGENTAPGTLALPAGFTSQVAQFASGAAPSDMAMIVGDAESIGSGATGAQTATSTAVNYPVGYLIGIVPAGAAAAAAPGLAVSPDVIHVQYRPHRRAIVGNGLLCGDGIAGPAPVTLGSPSPPRPFVARSAPPRRAVAGSNLSCGDGVAVPAPAAVPVSVPARPRPVVRAAPARARSGSLGLCAAGIASTIVTQRGSPSRPSPFVWRSPAPARSRLGNALSCADGIASAVVTPLGSPSSPAPRPAIQHLPARRARVGNNLGCGDGIASAITTPLGSASTPAPRPVIQHLPPVRARLAHGSPGYPGALNSNTGFETGTAPWNAVNGTLAQSSAQAYQGTFSALLTPAGGTSLAWIESEPIPVVPGASYTASCFAYSPAGWAGGAVANINWYDAHHAYLTTTGVSATALAAATWTFLTSTPSAVPAGAFFATCVPTEAGTPTTGAVVYFDSAQIATVAPYPYTISGTGTAGGGVASYAVTPLGLPSRPEPFIFRSPAPARAKAGPQGFAGSGRPSAAVTPLGAPGLRLPLRARSPQPRRVLWRGVASRAAATPGVIAYPAVIRHLAPPVRAHVGPYGGPAGGVASSNVPGPPYVSYFPSVPGIAIPGLFTPGDPGPVGAVAAYQRPPVYIKRPGSARGRAGAHAGIAGGIASAAVTPLGSAPSPALRPKVFPVRNARVVTGPRSRNAGGVASAITTPPGAPSSPAPRPVIQHLPPRRAAAGFLGRNAGGYPGHNACPAFPLAGPYVYQQMLVPAYSYPNPPSFWLNMMAGVPPVRYVVANVSSGPGATADPNYTAVINAALAAGLTVLGYVDTNYAAVPGATADANTALWQSLYGVTSIFFDRASALTGDEPYYATRASAVRATPGAITALNFGTIPDSGYMASADIAVVFEGDYATGWQTFTPAGWMAGYNPSRFCALVANARTTAQMQSVLVTAKTDGIGVVYVTPEPSPPTYSVWPGNQYCPSEAAQINADNAVAPLGRPVIQHLPPRRARVGNNLATGDGIASRVVTPLGAPGPRLPLQARSPAPRRSVSRGLASPVTTPLGAAGPKLPPQARRPAPSRGHWGGTAGPANAAAAAASPARPLPARSLAPRRALWHGLASGTVTPLGAPSRPKPFVARKPAARASAGRGGAAGGIASATVTPLGGPSSPLPRPVIQHLPSRRALTGNNLGCGDGIASRSVTPLGAPGPPRPFVARKTGQRVLWRGFASQVVTPRGSLGPPKPFTARKPSARALAGRGGTGSGIASAIVTPPGSPAPPHPLVIQHLPPRRGIGHGLAGLTNPALGTVAPARKVPLYPPRSARARVGPGTATGGIQALTNLAPGVAAYQRPPVYIKRPAPLRAVVGHGGVSGGIRGLANPPLSAATGQQHAWIFRSPLPARGRLGNTLGCGDGIASAVSTPLGGQSRPKPSVFRSPAPHRGIAGNNGQCGDGIGSQVTTPLGTPSRPEPFIFRSPAPGRARLGNNLLCGDGLASQVSTPLGVIAPPRLLLAWVSHPRARGQTGHGTVSGGIPGLVSTPLGSPSFPAPRPVIQHPPGRRAIAGPYGRNAAGVSGTVTPRGTVGPPRPFVARKSPARAVVGNNLTCADGIASQVVTPLGTPPVSIVRPVIVHVPPLRAHTGPLGRNGGGNPATAIAALGAPTARGPQMAPHAIPARARTGPQGRNAGGLTTAAVTQATAYQHAPRPAGRVTPGRARLGPLGRNTGGLAAPQAATAAMARRPSVFRSPAPHRAQAGNNLACGDGLSGPVNPPLGVIPPRRIRQPWASRPRTRAVTTTRPAAGGAFFTQGPGKVSAADSITRTVLAADRHVMSVSAADRLVMGVRASDDEP